jgi:hypothetical protein
MLVGLMDGILRELVLKELHKARSSDFCVFNPFMKSQNKYFTGPSKKVCKTSKGVSLTVSKPERKKGLKFEGFSVKS